MGRYVVVSGLPASEKTTLARAVAQSLGLPMLDKDDFLESLFEDAIVGSAQRRRELSQLADRAFRRVRGGIDGCCPCILVEAPHVHPSTPARPRTGSAHCLVGAWRFIVGAARSSQSPASRNASAIPVISMIVGRTQSC